MLTFTIDWILVAQLVASTILPILVALVTTRVTASGTKAVLLAVLSLVASLLAEAIRAWQAGEAYDVGLGLILALPTFAIAVATHYGLWRPTGVADAAAGVGRHAR